MPLRVAICSCSAGYAALALHAPNAGVKPNRVAQVTAWQALSATVLPERSGIGLNELLDLALDASEAEFDVGGDWLADATRRQLVGGNGKRTGQC